MTSCAAPVTLIAIANTIYSSAFTHYYFQEGPIADLGTFSRINNSYDYPTWGKMTAIKTRIRDIWDTAPLTVRICCVKFVQRVVLAHTSSVNPEPRVRDLLPAVADPSLTPCCSAVTPSTSLAIWYRLITLYSTEISSKLRPLVYWIEC